MVHQSKELSLDTNIPQNEQVAQHPDMLKSALIYAKYLEWSVFPAHSIKDGHCTCKKGAMCQNPGKHPRFNGWKEEATTNLHQIQRWWRQRPHSNIGVATGSPSGFWALDVDGPRGAASLEELTDKYGPLPDTVEAITGSGGRHILFKHHPGVGNSVKTLADGLDTRSTGGLIILSPSIHISGRRYDWEAMSRPLGENSVEISEAPDWLIAEIRKSASNSSGRGISKARGMDHWRHIIQGVGEGERNHSAASLAGYLLGRKVDPEITFQLLRGWNTFNHPPMEDDELFTTFKSILTKDQRQERSDFKIEY